MELDAWKQYSRNGLSKDRWAYFAKLINIVVYEIVANRELFSQADWRRVRRFLHVPLDEKVLSHLENVSHAFPKIEKLKGMTKDEYLQAQEAVRALAKLHRRPAIWFEAAWTA